MKEYTTPFIRNVALVSHSSAGKTMLAEAFLHFSGATTRLGKIEDGTTVSDFDEEELRRKISLYTSVIPVEYRDVKSTCWIHPVTPISLARSSPLYALRMAPSSW